MYNIKNNLEGLEKVTGRDPSRENNQEGLRREKLENVESGTVKIDLIDSIRLIHKFTLILTVIFNSFEGVRVLHFSTYQKYMSTNRDSIMSLYWVEDSDGFESNFLTRVRSVAWVWKITPLLVYWVKKYLIESGQKIPMLKTSWRPIYCGLKVLLSQVWGHL